MNVKKCPSNIWRWDSNPQPFEHESSPMTTRPALPPSKVILCVTFVACAASWAKVTALVCSTEQGGRKDEGREIDKPFVSHSLPSISPYTLSLSLSLSLSLERSEIMHHPSHSISNNVRLTNQSAEWGKLKPIKIDCENFNFLILLHARPGVGT